MSAVDYGVYLVTDAPEKYPRGLRDGVDAALDGGVGIVQFRATTGSRREQYELARELRELLRPRGVPLIVNDCVDLALAVDADGVHVGQSDLPVEIVRRLIGPGRLLGLSITDARQLEQVGAGVDYLGVGPVFATPTKPDAAPALGLEGLRRISERATLPVVAIGGINLGNAASVFRAGADGVAVVSALSQAENPAEVARALRRLRG